MQDPPEGGERFLGNMVSQDGIAPDPTKVEAVVHWPVPKTLTKVRAFVGLASYYRRFIKSFVQVARPLHELTRKNHVIRWGEEQQEAFETLKRSLVEALVLSSPRDVGEYVVDADASGEALGAVLSQW